MVVECSTKRTLSSFIRLPFLLTLYLLPCHTSMIQNRFLMRATSIGLALLLLCPTPIIAQTNIAWQHLLNTPTLNDTRLDDIATTPDGAYLTSGYRADTVGSANYSFFCAKFQPDANQLEQMWEYGGIGEEQSNAMTVLPNGNAILVGHSNSPDGDVGKANGGVDVWVVCIDAHGNLLWSRVWGGSLNEDANDVSLANDGNVWVTGFTESADTNLTYNAGYKDLFLLKIAAATGDILLQRTYGGTGNDVGFAVEQHPQTNTVWVGGYSSSADGDASGGHGSKDYWLLTIDPTNGNLRRQRMYGGSQSDGLTDLCLTADGNVALLGDSLSDDGEVGGNVGQDDFWVLKVDTVQGNIVWQTHVGDFWYDQSRGITELGNGDLMAVGTTFDPSVLPPDYTYDLQIVKLNGANGSLKWKQRLGGSNYDFANRMIPALNGGYMLACSTDSQDGDIDTGGGRHGSHRGWLVRLSEITGLQDSHYPQPQPLQLYPNPSSNELNLVLPQHIRPNTTAQLCVYTVQGQLLYQQTLLANAAATVSLPTEQYAAGTYYVQLNTPNEWYRQVWVKY